MFTDEQIRQWNATLEGAPPERILRWAADTFGPGLVATSSFQTQSLPLLHMISREIPETPVLFLDTGFHFQETLEFRDRLAREWSLELQVVVPELEPEAFRSRHGELYRTDPDSCCGFNKVRPLERVLAAKTAWLSGIRRDQTAHRAATPVLARRSDGLYKVCPLAAWTARDVARYARGHGLPEHPLTREGYRSVGCRPCTRPACAQGDDRAGRWAGLEKTECGLHLEAGVGALGRAALQVAPAPAALAPRPLPPGALPEAREPSPAPSSPPTHPATRPGFAPGVGEFADQSGEAPGPPRRSGFTVWFTGLSGSGKTTLCLRLAAELRARGHAVEVLDGDVVRQHLGRGLGFSRQDRDENIRRIGFVAGLLASHGVIVLVAAISPYREARDEQRRRLGRFVEVYASAPLEACEARDVKGLYRRARAGEIPHFTGLGDPYEPPLAPEVECPTHREGEERSLQRIVTALEPWLAAAPASLPRGA